MKPVRDPLFLKWIRTLPSVVPSRSRYVEAAHIGGRGLSQKASDYSTVPLTPALHRELHAIGRVKFERKYGVELHAWAVRLSQRPLVFIRDGRLAASFPDYKNYTGDIPEGDIGVFDLGALKQPVAWDELFASIRELRTEQLIQEIKGGGE
jgi:hypothetical protein